MQNINTKELISIIKSNKIIGFKGPKTVGKTTLSNKIIEELDEVEIKSFATPIKNLAHSILSPEELKLPKERLRVLYVSIGEGYRKFNPNFWVNHAISTINSEKITIFDDARQLNEAMEMDVLIMLSRDGVNYTNENITEKDFDKKDIEKLESNGVKVYKYQIKNEE